MPMFAFAPFYFVFFWLLAFLLSLLFVVIAAKLATRVVLDEIARDRERRARTGGP